jgi:hypothetical protein
MAVLTGAPTAPQSYGTYALALCSRRAAEAQDRCRSMGRRLSKASSAAHLAAVMLAGDLSNATTTGPVMAHLVCRRGRLGQGPTAADVLPFSYFQGGGPTASGATA